MSNAPWTLPSGEAFRPRPPVFTGIRELAGYRIKTYRIAWAPPGKKAGDIDEELYAPGWELLEEALPQPPQAPMRPGVGFAIAHQGKDVAYLVLAWWDQENELPIRVFVRPTAAYRDWRPARAAESICVWDIEVLRFERDAYVEEILSRPERPDLEAYLARVAGSG